MHLQLALTRGLHLQFGTGPHRLQLELYRGWVYIRLPFIGEWLWNKQPNWTMAERIWTGWAEVRAGETDRMGMVEDV
jgi:hypothetical protein